MRILYHKNFLKNYKKRIPRNSKLEKQFGRKLKLFIENPGNPILRDHRLVGKKGEYRSFSITGDVRVVYKRLKDVIVLYDIGSHNQVY